jgi:antitoxin FitA
MQVYLRELLEREYRAERNKQLFERLTRHRALDLDVDEVVEYIRQGREDGR